MADAKYGQIFPYDDVRKIVAHIIDNHIDDDAPGIDSSDEFIAEAMASITPRFPVSARPTSESCNSLTSLQC